MNEGCQLKENNSGLTEIDGSVFIKTEGQTSRGMCMQWRGAESQSNFQHLIGADGRLIHSYFGDYRSQEVQVYINDRIISVEPKLIFELTPGERKEWSVRHMF